MLEYNLLQRNSFSGPPKKAMRMKPRNNYLRRRVKIDCKGFCVIFRHADILKDTKELTVSEMGPDSETLYCIVSFRIRDCGNCKVVRVLN
jgi:hypothetical protein